MNKWLLIAVLLAASPAKAVVHKCKAPDGKITYTDNGCPQGQDVSGRDQAADEAAHGNGATPRPADSGGGGYYRQQVKSAEQSAPKPDPQRP